jgi:hypothetical protein
MTETLHSRPARVDQNSGSRWLPVAVAAGSLYFGVFGTSWALGRGTFPFGVVPPDGDRLSVLSQLPVDLAAGLVGVLGCLGVPAALAFRRTGWSPSAYRPLLAFSAVQAVVFGLFSTDLIVVILTGYLLALLGVPAFLVFLLAGAVRQRTTRLLFGAVLAILMVLQLTNGLFDWSAIKQVAEGMSGVPAKVGVRPLFVAGAFALGGGWALLTIRGLRAARHRCETCGRPGARWTTAESARRWGFWATIVAVLCPMPYALLRLTWLLPNPVGFDAAELDADPGIKLFGVGLGVVALTSGLVTLGLIRPWGEVWPRWMPVLAGRPVPIRAAVIPGAIAATLLLVGSSSLIGMLWSSDATWQENVKGLLLFPFPLWGTAVALATAAYYYRRRGRCSSCHQG